MPKPPRYEKAEEIEAGNDTIEIKIRLAASQTTVRIVFSAIGLYDAF
jgi:hypothetical protein